MGSSDAPQITHLALFLTERCNLACRYCFAASRRGGNITAERARRAVDLLLDLAGDARRVSLTFWGGEPLLVPALLFDVARFARDRAAEQGRRITLGLPTNATLLSDATLQAIQEHDIRTYLSVDGDREAQADRPLRDGRPSHERLADTLPRAFSALTDPPPTVRMTLTPHNVAQLDHNVRYFARLGARRVAFYPDLDRPWPDPVFEALDQALERLEPWWSTRLLDDEPAAVLQLPSLHRPLRLAVMGKPPQASRRGCGVGERMMAVDVHGRIHPCHRFVFYARDRNAPGFALGDVERGLDRDAFASLHDRCRPEAAHRSDGQSCDHCRMSASCGFACPAISYCVTGRLDHVPDEACRIQQRFRRTAEQVARRVGSTVVQRHLGLPEVLAETDDGSLYDVVAKRAADLLEERVS